MKAITTLGEHAADLWGVPPALVFGETRTSREAVEARFAVMHVAVKRLGISAVKTARALGRDHSTVLHGCRRAEALAADNLVFRALLDQLAEFSRDIPQTAFVEEITGPTVARKYLRRISNIAIEQLISLAQENPEGFRDLLVLAMRGELERQVDRELRRSGVTPS
jgi:hypothetical protein